MCYNHFLNEVNFNGYSMESTKMADVVKKYSDIEGDVEKSLGERKSITNRRGNIVTPRKYHMTDAQLDKGRANWLEQIKGVSDVIKGKSASLFFNPYRANGGYYGGIQALFLLGSNAWHPYGDVRGKMQDDMSTRKSPTNKKHSWEKFAYRSAREGAASTKDLMGRIVQNFRTLQRLGGVHPYGWKLAQLGASVDIRRTEKGIYEFRLNTSWVDMNSVVPFYDVSSYECGVKKGPRGHKVDSEAITSVVEVAV